MELGLDARLRRLVRRVPPVSVYRLSELLMMALVAVLAARLFWTVVTPVTPLGVWSARFDAAVPRDLAAFDPFFRNSVQDGPVVVTSLQLKLFGIRLNEAAGGGSAIVEIPGEGQQSYAAGQEIQPGVALKAIGFDHIVISRGGIDEQLFMDQSGVGVDPAAGAAATSVRPASAAGFASAFSVGARTEGGRVTGVTVQPTGDGAAFREMGLQPGDILVSVNGEGVRSSEDVARQVADMPPGGATTIEVERGGQRVTLNPVVK